MEVLEYYGVIGRRTFASRNSQVFEVGQSIFGRVAVKVISSEQFDLLESKQVEESCKDALSVHPCFLPLLTCEILSINSTEYLCLTFPWKQCLSLELKHRTENALQWDEPVLLRYCYQLLSLLAFAQEHNISHRDIKPANIFLEDKNVLLGDFGSAKRNESNDQTFEATVVGSYPFVSPELGQQLNVTSRTRYNPYKSDLYSLGRTLLTLASLVQYSRSEGDPLAWTLSQLHSIAPRYPKLTELLTLMLVVDPKERLDCAKLLRWLWDFREYRCVHLMLSPEFAAFMPCCGYECAACCQASEQRDLWSVAKCVVCGMKTMAQILNFTNCCQFCKRYCEVPAVRMACSHSFCSEPCLRSHMEKCFLKNAQEPTYECVLDRTKIEEDIYLRVFGSHEDFKFWKELRLSHAGICPNCRLNGAKERFGCGHVICINCAQIPKKMKSTKDPRACPLCTHV